MVRTLDVALFGFLVLSNLSLGLYFSFRKRNTTSDSSAARSEVFLASRMLKTLPLAASSVASLFSSTGLVGFPCPLLRLRLAPLLGIPVAFVADSSGHARLRAGVVQAAHHVDIRGKY
ncbi:hypothetical protein MTO96_031966 [Rhipicephalus appendiculatus]